MRSRGENADRWLTGRDDFATRSRAAQQLFDAKADRRNLKRAAPIEYSISPFELSQTHQNETPQCCEMVVHFEMEGAEEMGVRLHQSSAKAACRKPSLVTMWRTACFFWNVLHSGITDFHGHLIDRREAPLLCENEVLSLQNFVDACSVEVFVEVFAGDGAIYLVGLFFPISRGKGELFIRGKARVAHLES